MNYQCQYNAATHAFGRVAVLFGGNSAEREISLQSGGAVLQALQKLGIDAFAIDIQKNAVAQLSQVRCDRAFIALHGIGGEDGRIQALLEWLDIPYTGSGVAASALALNKLRTKQVWTSCALPTPEYQVLTAEAVRGDAHGIVGALGGACFIKPVNEGSSIGMSCVDHAEALQEAFALASKGGSAVIAERRIVGREFTVAILNGCALPSIQLRVKNAFYDYEAKYLSDATEYLCPSGLTDAEERELGGLALRAFDALGCEGWGRIDFMQDGNGRFYLLEANTVPGMTSHSLVPMAAKAAGLSFESLVCEILLQTCKS